MLSSTSRARRALLGALAIPIAGPAPAQAVVAAWGNVEGIRVNGEVVPFETSLCLVDSMGAVRTRTARERQTPRFQRSGSTRTITTRLGAYSIIESVEDVRPGEVRLDVKVTADSATTLRPALCVDTPEGYYGDVSSGPTRRLELAGAMSSIMRHVAIDLGNEATLQTSRERRDGRVLRRVMVPLVSGPSPAGSAAHATLTLTATGTPNDRPITLVLDTRRPGRVWDGLGGNFRIQNPTLDPKVIAYNLANLRVAWARVEMPWRSWHPDSAADPAAKDTAQQDPRVRAAMAMARTAAQKGMPVIVSAWFPPQVGRRRPAAA